MYQKLLDIQHLTVAFTSGGEPPPLLLNDIEVTVAAGASVGLIGESGAGKTMLSRAIFRALPEADTRLLGGKIRFKEKNLLDLAATEFRSLLGTRISLLFQEPSQALDPVFTLGEQLTETVSAHVDLGPDEAETLARDWLRRVGLDDPERIMRAYPFELSGGMLQRAALAQALLLRPELLVADEPTTALDSSLKVIVLQLLDRLRKELNMSLLMVSHDLAAVGWCCEKTMVLLSGTMVETGPTGAVLKRPAHPYTEQLLLSARRKTAVSTSKADVAAAGRCPFLARCRRASAVCHTTEPPWVSVGDKHRVRCHGAVP